MHVGADRAEQIPATTAVPAPQGRDRTTIVLGSPGGSRQAIHGTVTAD